MDKKYILRKYLYYISVSNFHCASMKNFYKMITENKYTHFQRWKHQYANINAVKPKPNALKKYPQTYHMIRPNQPIK